jgi:hypothetical protein
MPGAGFEPARANTHTHTHTKAGHQLAEKSLWDKNDVKTAFELALFYKRQLPPDLKKIIFFWLNECEKKFLKFALEKFPEISIFFRQFTFHILCFQYCTSLLTLALPENFFTSSPKPIPYKS